MSGEVKVRVGPKFRELKNTFRDRLAARGITATDREILEALAEFLVEEKIDLLILRRIDRQRPPGRLFDP